MILTAPETFEEYLPLAIYILIVSGISYVITLFIAKKNKKVIFLLPIMFFVLSVLLVVYAFIADGWDKLGYFILAMLSIGAFIGSFISSLLIYFSKKSDEKNQVKL